jgi:hypothetical protein
MEGQWFCEWVAVESRVPDLGDAVLVWHTAFNPSAEIGERIGDGAWQLKTKVGKQFTSLVSHWMPLPPSPAGISPAAMAEEVERQLQHMRIDNLSFIRELANKPTDS